MKKTIHSFQNNMCQMMCNWGFLLAGMAVCLLMLTSEISIYDTFGTESKTILEVIFFKGREWISSSGEICWEELFLHQPQRGLCDYITIVTSLPFLVMFFREHTSGALRNRIFMEGKKRFCLTRVFCGAICGGGIVLLGQILFLVIVRCFFPPAQVILEAEQIDLLLGNHTVAQAVLLQSGSMFLYGFGASLFSIVLSAFTRDFYICLMLPFLINWLLVILQSYLTSLLIVDYPDATGTVWTVLRWVQNYGRLDCLAYIELWQCGIVVAVLSVLAGFIFTRRMEKRRDQGA